ncbi:Rad4 transglutaminase-like domain-containing protein [Pyrenochaeta sp. MPI-SDFR-AT-0127]|nr:Rad4 transglutaminase-like domain-containing protein [Pyrenochaeta sp. MPI-SDFR-AT-0127]
MPPVLSRKRLQSDSPKPEPPPKRARTPKPPAPRSKESVFQTLDAPPKVTRTLSQTKALLEQEDDESELTEPESSEDEFEHVPLNGARKSVGPGEAQQHKTNDDESDHEDWEDALGEHHLTILNNGPAPAISGDIALTLSAAPKTAFDYKPEGKKGPSKVQRQIRNLTHCMHVQYLMFHNLIRNAWIQDKEVQGTLVANLSPGCWREIEQYWRDSGISDGPTRVIATHGKVQRASKKDAIKESGTWKESSKKGVRIYESPQSRWVGKAKDRSKAVQGKDNATPKSNRSARDWGATSEPLEPNMPNLSAGDPLLRLLRYLSAYWKSKYKITAPSLRKRGYLSPSTLEAEIMAFKDNPVHPDTFGERVRGLEAFRERARRCDGSRDVGQQLFTALIRGLGIESRMVVSLQPVGFGWSQSEEGRPKNLEKLKDVAEIIKDNLSAKSTQARVKPKLCQATNCHTGSDDVDILESSDLSSVITISSDSEVEQTIRKSPKARDYSEEFPYPTYWTEVISHLTNTPISVSPLPRTLVASASTPDKLGGFYARGAAADKARQVLAYLIAFSSDGTAKDVTVRYLPKHQWPGRTKGFRMPVEKIPIHNKHGKVKRWEEWDWFKALMRPYARPHEKRQPWDEVEDEGDLVPMKLDKKKEMDEEGGRETLQGYKTSAEYVLQRHLRREEALKPGAMVVRNFVTGKGVNEKTEPVYRRKDILYCKTAESWHKEGREVKEGEQPLKFVPMRAVTVTRKREIEERERVEGGKVQQGLYSKAQTKWIIPDPIIGGKIPRNAFGNIDVYVKTMIPRGAIHIPFKGTARICRKLNIDHAEACTGFEFGKQRAVPVLTGVVVAAENENLVIDAWEIEEAEKAKKEADKRKRMVLGLWKKFFSGLRIVERMKAEYGDEVEHPAKKVEVAPKNNAKSKKSEWEVFQTQTNFEGGFLRDDSTPFDAGFLQAGQLPAKDITDMAGVFFPASQDDLVHGDLTIEQGDEEQGQQCTLSATNVYRTPISLTSALQRPVSEASGYPDHDDFMNDQWDDIGSYRSPKIQSPRARSCGRGTTLASDIHKRKSLLRDPSDNESSVIYTPSVPPRTKAPTRSVPKRKAAYKSGTQVHSHFFADRSDGETDLTDMTNRDSPKKAAPKRGKAKCSRAVGKRKTDR